MGYAAALRRHTAPRSSVPSEFVQLTSRRVSSNSRHNGGRWSAAGTGKGTQHEMAGSFGRRARVGPGRRLRPPRRCASSTIREAKSPPIAASSDEMRDSGERLVIDGPCLSACTLVHRLHSARPCLRHAARVLGFHAASYYDDARRSLVPTRAGTRLVMRLYPPRNPQLDRPAWRPDARNHYAARPRTCGALSTLPLTRRAHCRRVRLSRCRHSGLSTGAALRRMRAEMTRPCARLSHHARCRGRSCWPAPRL